MNDAFRAEHKVTRWVEKEDQPKPDPTPETLRAQEAAGKTWKWWGPIERPWAPDPYITPGNPNLVEWFKSFFRSNPDRK